MDNSIKRLTTGNGEPPPKHPKRELPPVDPTPLPEDPAAPVDEAK